MSAEMIEVLDTTLRDGNKLPFVVLDRHDRLVIARQLAALGVDVIDAGYPAASPEERQCVELIARGVREPAISALSRATEQDVSATAQLLRLAARPHLHVFLPASPVFFRDVLQLDPGAVLALVARCLEVARGTGMRLQFSFGEAAEADRGFLLEAVRAAGEGGAAVVNLADTNGGLHPVETAGLVQEAVTALADLPEVVVGVHLHNDLGLATAGTLSALEAGARHVEATVGGIGPRSGNAPLEEVIFGLEAFADRLRLGHRIRLEQLAATSALLARLSGVSPHPNKPILGRCAFLESRGMEARRALAPHLRELLQEQRIGRGPDALFGEREMTRTGFEQQLQLMGSELGVVDLGAVDLDKAFSLLQAHLRRKGSVLVSELREILDEARLEEERPYELASFNVMTGSQTLPLGSVELKTGEGKTIIQSSHGSGPVDALCRAVDRAVGLKPRLLLYSVDSVTEGKDARAVVTVSLAYMGRRFHGHSGSTDLIEASLRAYLDAVNSIQRYRKSAPQGEEFYIDGELLWWE